MGLWTRLDGFARPDLTRALESATIVQGTLMRGTIHLVSREAYWPFAVGIRAARRAWAARVSTIPSEAELRDRGDALRAALASGPRTVAELGELGKGFVGDLGYWVDLVRVPPSGTWEHRRADRLALAETWIGPDDATEAEGVALLVTTYLRAFGPAPFADIAAWAGIPVAAAREGATGLDLIQ